ncbi:MAG: hypothetical protein PHQ27_07970, partial [Victivallales bacterium]|nr:hypothetical protein [Victivallales bacterium]
EDILQSFAGRREPEKSTSRTIYRHGHIPREELLPMIDEAMRELENKNIEEAENKIRLVLIFAPDNIKAMTILGQIMYFKGRYREAEHIFRRQLHCAPYHATAYNNLAAVMTRQKCFSEALTHIDRAAELAPDSPEILINQAGIMTLNGDYDRAIQQFAAAAKLLGPLILFVSGDHCFDAIRNRPEFQKIIRGARHNVDSFRREKGLLP